MPFSPGAVRGKRWVEGKEKSERDGWSEMLRGRRREVQASRMEWREARDRRALEEVVAEVEEEASRIESVTQTREGDGSREEMYCGEEGKEAKASASIVYDAPGSRATSGVADEVTFPLQSSLTACKEVRGAEPERTSQFPLATFRLPFGYEPS
jgi:hypothetical protein